VRRRDAARNKRWGAEGRDDLVRSTA